MSTLKLEHKERKRKQRELRQRQAKQGIRKPGKQTLLNRNCRWKTPEEETVARQQATENTLHAFRRVLPGLLCDLAQIPDPRNPLKVKHKLTVLLFYGILAFVFQFTSRREAGKEMSRPMFFENLQTLFPELETLPHQDTLCRLLKRIGVEEIEEAHLKMFERLVRRLFANGPVMALCRRNHWEYMIVLQDGSLPSVWEEAKGLHKLQPEQTLERQWKGRRQSFWWVNHIIYEYGNNGRLKQTVHVVVCEETWEEVGTDGQIESKSSRHAWLSSEPIAKNNIHERCNRIARSRWRLENDILKEKRQGYQYEHIFAQEWKAMKGYHYLMHIAHFMNELALHTVGLIELVEEMGICGFLCFLRNTIAGPWLNLEHVRQWVQHPSPLRLAA